MLLYARCDWGTIWWNRQDLGEGLICGVSVFLDNVDSIGPDNKPASSKEASLRHALQVHNFIEKKDIGQQGANMQGGVEIVDQLG